MNNEWLQADVGKPWEFLRFVADALEKGEELECECQCYNGNWISVCFSAAFYNITDGIFVRARIKPKSLAPHWKPFTDDVVLYAEDLVLAEDDLYLCDGECDREVFDSDWTHYARKADLLHGVGDD